MINLEQRITHLHGKHIKAMLTKLESLNILTVDVRKIVLDEMNELLRDIIKELIIDEPAHTY